jgi:signal peptidase II
MASITETAPETGASDTPKATPELHLALSCWRSHVRFWLVMILGLTADLWTKDWAELTLKGRPPQIIIENALSFHYSTNKGALFGMGQQLTWLFVTASLAALIFVLYVFAKSATDQRSFHLALGMILAGALGNLYDRLFVGGEVRDFIKIELHIGDFEIWPWIFNVADMLLVCGVSILMLNIWFGRKHPGTYEGEQAAV